MEHGMKRDLDKWSLVVLGQWNTAILSPDWLAREFFHQKEVRIMYPVLGGGRPIFEAADMRVVVSRNNIVFVPLKDDPEVLNRIESGARHVLTTLPHTPVNAFGENFHYVADARAPGLEKVLTFADADDLDKNGTTSEVALRRSLEIDNHRLNLTIASGEGLQIELNYHYDVSDATQARERMENTYRANRDHGLQLLDTIYNLILDEGTPS